MRASETTSKSEINNAQINLNFVHNGFDSTLEESIMNFRIAKNYDFAIEELLLKNESYSDFMEMILAKFINKYEFTFGSYKTTYFEDDRSFIILSENGSSKKINIYSKDLQNFYELYKLYKLHSQEVGDNYIVKYSEISPSPQGLKITSKELNFKSFENLNEKYYPFLDVNLMIQEFIESKENILILTGKPGVGKSKLFGTIMKKLIQDEKYYNSLNSVKLRDESTSEGPSFDFDDKAYKVASAKNVSLLAQDAFWTEIEKYNFLLLDDLDFVLSSRDKSREDVEKNQLLSNILSFSDGVTDNNVKIIITTNQPFSDLDSALLRKGRLFAILDFRSLTSKEALDIWLDEGLEEELFYEHFDQEEIPQSELGHIIDNLKRNNNKFIERKDFILDPAIDAMNKAKKHKTGFV